jgi:hypothetical protein
MFNGVEIVMSVILIFVLLSMETTKKDVLSVTKTELCCGGVALGEGTIEVHIDISIIYLAVKPRDSLSVKDSSVYCCSIPIQLPVLSRD